MAAHSTSGGPNAIALCNLTYHCAAAETYGATLVNADLQLNWKKDLARNKTCKMDANENELEWEADTEMDKQLLEMAEREEGDGRMEEEGEEDEEEEVWEECSELASDEEWASEDDEEEGEDEEGEEDGGDDEDDDNDDDNAVMDDEGNELEDDEEEEEEAVMEEDAASSGDEAKESCPICLCSFCDQEVGTPESCDHTFCLECIQEWSKNVTTCPVDRSVFSLILVRNSLDGEVVRQLEVKVQEALDDDPTYCEVCGECDREDRLLLCDNCDAGYHCECLTPPLADIPVEEWFCPNCVQHDDESSEEEYMAALRRPLRRVREFARAIARTTVARRVLARVNQAREQRQAEEQIEAGTSSTPTRAPTRPKTTRKRKTTKRKTTKRKTTKRKTTKRKTGTKRKVKRKTTSATSTTGKKKRKVRRRKRKVKKGRRTSSGARTAMPVVKTTIRGRIAQTLNLVKPKVGSMMPDVKPKGDHGHSLLSKRYDIGVTALSLTGGDHLFDQSGYDETPRGPGAQSAPTEWKEPAPSTSSGGPLDLLGSIMQSQDMLRLKSSDVKIHKDGTLSTLKKAAEAPPRRRPSTTTKPASSTTSSDRTALILDKRSLSTKRVTISGDDKPLTPKGIRERAHCHDASIDRSDSHSCAENFNREKDSNVFDDDMETVDMDVDSDDDDEQYQDPRRLGSKGGLGNEGHSHLHRSNEQEVYRKDRTKDNLLGRMSRKKRQVMGGDDSDEEKDCEENNGDANYRRTSDDDDADDQGAGDGEENYQQDGGGDSHGGGNHGDENSVNNNNNNNGGEGEEDGDGDGGGEENNGDEDGNDEGEEDDNPAADEDDDDDDDEQEQDEEVKEEEEEETEMVEDAMTDEEEPVEKEVVEEEEEGNEVEEEGQEEEEMVEEDEREEENAGEEAEDLNTSNQDMQEPIHQEGREQKEEEEEEEEEPEEEEEEEKEEEEDGDEEDENTEVREGDHINEVIGEVGGDEHHETREGTREENKGVEIRDGDKDGGEEEEREEVDEQSEEEEEEEEEVEEVEDEEIDAEENAREDGGDNAEDEVGEEQQVDGEHGDEGEEQDEVEEEEVEEVEEIEEQEEEEEEVEEEEEKEVEREEGEEGEEEGQEEMEEGVEGNVEGGEENADGNRSTRGDAEALRFKDAGHSGDEYSVACNQEKLNPMRDMDCEDISEEENDEIQDESDPEDGMIIETADGQTIVHKNPTQNAEDGTREVGSDVTKDNDTEAKHGASSAEEGEVKTDDESKKGKKARNKRKRKKRNRDKRNVVVDPRKSISLLPQQGPADSPRLPKREDGRREEGRREEGRREGSREGFGDLRQVIQVKRDTPYTAEELRRYHEEYWEEYNRRRDERRVERVSWEQYSYDQYAYYEMWRNLGGEFPPNRTWPMHVQTDRSPIYDRRKNGNEPFDPRLEAQRQARKDLERGRDDSSRKSTNEVKIKSEHDTERKEHSNKSDGGKSQKDRDKLAKEKNGSKGHVHENSARDKNGREQKESAADKSKKNTNKDKVRDAKEKHLEKEKEHSRHNRDSDRGREKEHSRKESEHRKDGHNSRDKDQSKESHRSGERHRSRDRDRSRERDQVREKERSRDGRRSRERDQSRDKERSRDAHQSRDRLQSKDREREQSRDRSRRGNRHKESRRSRSRDHERRRSGHRSRSRERERSRRRDRSSDSDHYTSSRDKKKDKAREKTHEPTKAKATKGSREPNISKERLKERGKESVKMFTKALKEAGSLPKTTKAKVTVDAAGGRKVELATQPKTKEAKKTMEKPAAAKTEKVKVKKLKKDKAAAADGKPEKKTKKTKVGKEGKKVTKGKKKKAAAKRPLSFDVDEIAAPAKKVKLKVKATPTVFSVKDTDDMAQLLKPPSPLKFDDAEDNLPSTTRSSPDLYIDIAPSDNDLSRIVPESSKDTQQTPPKPIKTPTDIAVADSSHLDTDTDMYDPFNPTASPPQEGIKSPSPLLSEASPRQDNAATSSAEVISISKRASTPPMEPEVPPNPTSTTSDVSSSDMAVVAPPVAPGQTGMTNEDRLLLASQASQQITKILNQLASGVPVTKKPTRISPDSPDDEEPIGLNLSKSLSPNNLSASISPGLSPKRIGGSTMSVSSFGSNEKNFGGVGLEAAMRKKPEEPSSEPPEEDIEMSAVDLYNKNSRDRYLKKLYHQERVVEEVKLALKPHYQRKVINKDDYKEILRKSVNQVCHSKTGEINPVKIRRLIDGYVKKCSYKGKKGDAPKSSGKSSSSKSSGGKGNGGKSSGGGGLAGKSIFKSKEPASASKLIEKSRSQGLKSK